MSGVAFRSLAQLRGPSAADLVFEELYRQIVEARLLPGAKLSEQDVARQMQVSRQPVRDAFYRLSKLGLVHIQPQRATTVALVSEKAVLQARFVRTALETETARVAAGNLAPETVRTLEGLLAAQEAAVEAQDRIRFHTLDDEFHQAICAAAGQPFVWSLIRENKAHMDRVRWMSLSFGARLAYDDHVRLFRTLVDGDPEAAATEMRIHLSRIVDTVALFRREQPDFFEPTGP